MKTKLPVRLIPVVEEIDVWVIRTEKDKEDHDWWWGRQRREALNDIARRKNYKNFRKGIGEALNRQPTQDPGFDYSDESRDYRAFKEEGSVFDVYDADW